VKISIIILTYNSETSISTTLRSVACLSDDIFVVDSFSTDHTVKIASAHGANVVQHAFEHYGAQRNWAISSLPFRYRWQLHLDADEWLTPELCEEIRTLPEEGEFAGFYLPRMMCFLGRTIRHGGLAPTWHMRLFRTEHGQCEDRRYDQHFYIRAGRTARLNGHVIDDVRMCLSEWTSRHNRWSDAEVQEQCSGDSTGRIKGRPFGTPVERKRFLRDLYNDFPLFLRPFALFFYRYVIRFGFLDGSEGFIFYLLQTFWFRLLIDAKLFERRAIPRISIRNNCETDGQDVDGLLNLKRH
jgi:glycosyltransferase involved in cell wall biosynthesis